MTGENLFEVSITRSTLDVARQAVKQLVGMRAALVDERSRCVAALAELEALILEIDRVSFQAGPAWLAELEALIHEIDRGSFEPGPT